MKKIMAIIAIVGLSLCYATPVFAADPPTPDVDVGVTVTTPGDVNLGVDVNAGGGVNVTVDGVDLNQTAAAANAAYNQVFAPHDGLSDWTWYWNESGIGKQIDAKFAALKQLTDLLTAAEAKLIQGQQLTSNEINTIQVSLNSANNASISDLHNINDAIASLQSQDAKTWAQLMNGAETHLTLLTGTVNGQADTIASLQTTVAEQQSQIDAMNLEISDLRNSSSAVLVDVGDLKAQFLDYLMVMAACIVGLLTASVILAVKLHHKISKF
ncbi:MAG: hypothetical protein ACYDHZ_00935 [Dehalococcoidia bacterium]